MWVYALYNADKDKIYIGQTGNLDRRLVEHNQKRGNHYTAKTDGERILIYKEEIPNRKSAIIRERKLKSYKGREFIKNLLKSKDSVPR